MMSVQGSWALAWALMLTSCAATPNKYDIAIADRCPDVVSTEPSRAALDSAAGGDNWFLTEVLYKADDSEDIWTKTIEYMQGDGATDVAPKAVGLVLFILLLLTWWCCCYTCCPCCKCCRVCRAKEQKKSTDIVCKLIGTILILGIGAGLVVCWIFSVATYEDISNGSQRLGCTAAKMSKALVEGQTSPNFIGMTPLTNRFTSLSDILDDGSDFVTDFNQLIDNTVEIDQAFSFATETLELLKDMMSESANRMPKGHTCLLCDTLSGELTDVLDTMADSLASALTNARAEAKAALDADKREDLRRLLDDSVEPLSEVNELLLDALDPLVDGENWDMVESSVTEGRLSMYILPAYGLLAVICGGLGCLAFSLRESGADGQTQALPHRCACCSWCCGFFVAALCFLAGGFLQTLGVPLGVTCLTLDGFNGDVIDGSSDALELDLTGDSLTMVKNIVDQCLNPSDVSVSANFADVLLTTSAGSTQTMRQLIEADLKEAIDAPFAELQTKLSSANTALANNTGVTGLRELLSVYGASISEFIVTDGDSMNALIAADGITGEDVTMITSLACSNSTTFDDVPILGMDAYFSGPSALTESDYDLTVTMPCSSSALPPCFSEANCKASSFVIQTKEDLRNDVEFRCDVFQDASGTECPVWTQRVDGVAADYVTCMGSDNTYSRLPKNCTLTQFETYLAEFNERIKVAFTTLDDTTATMTAEIDVGLRELIDDNVVSEVTEILDGMGCNFLGEFYQSIIWGACYEGVGGMAYLGFLYVIVGALMCVLIIVTYAMWRRSVDNYNWDMEHPGDGGYPASSDDGGGGDRDESI
ncbi:unnamed protein product [Prorocentrum cordatum]|uniref:Uncharacterized protein n=1 Tax=Prorocentrum cordatum TaxID=2364126 RepID=A0ABN9P734_9DINO|nr:unnamed protein product [Polarella glacialis]